MQSVDDLSPKRILSIDGGGIKGAMAASYLAAIEQEVGEPLGGYFDLITGTSTGGLIALALGLRIPAKEIEDLYINLGAEIFSQDVPVGLSFFNNLYLAAKGLVRPKYSPEALRAALEGVFGGRTLGESETRLVIPAYSDIPKGPYVFKTAHHERFRTDYRKMVVDVGLATAAAPSFFKQHVLPTGEELIDGGVWANNPIGVAVLEATCVLGWHPSSLHVLSIGYPEAIHTYPRAGGKLHFAFGKIADLLLEGQGKVAMSTARLIMGEKARQRIYRDEVSLPHNYFKMDDTAKINRLVGIGKSMARRAYSDLRDSFFLIKADNFKPEHEAITNAKHTDNFPRAVA